MRLFKKTESAANTLHRLRGIIAYHASSPRDAFELLSALPVQKRLKDFSALGSAGLEAKLSVFSDVPPFPLERLQTLSEGRPNLPGFLELQGLFRGFFQSRDGLFFVHGFPANVEEAQSLETHIGGPNLFVRFVGGGDAQARTPLLGCARCGRTEKTAALGHVGCVDRGACDLQPLPAESGEAVGEALTRFYDDRGLALTFELRAGVDQRRELLERLLVAVKY